MMNDVLMVVYLNLIARIIFFKKFGMQKKSYQLVGKGVLEYWMCYWAETQWQQGFMGC